MNHKVYWFKWVAIYTIIWIILLERITLLSVISGVFVAILSLWYTDKYLIGTPFHHVYTLHLHKIIRYTVFMIGEIYKAGIQTLIMTVTGKINPGIVEFESTLTNPLDRMIMANSITLTPGTITIDVVGSKFKVLWIDTQLKEEGEVYRMLALPLEEKLK